MQDTCKLLPTRVLPPLSPSISSQNPTPLLPFPPTKLYQLTTVVMIKHRTTTMATNLEPSSVLDEPRSFYNGGFFFDLGHPLLNRVADSFVKAAGIGAIKAVATEGCHLALEGNGSSTPPDLTASTAKNNRKHPFPYLRGETNRNSLEAMVKSTGKESLEWGLAAGLYSGFTYGLQEARGTHDWKNSAVAGALTGMTVALACEEGSNERLLQCAITGAAISSAANLLTGTF